jgi:hypothetical protein
MNSSNRTPDGDPRRSCFHGSFQSACVAPRCGRTVSGASDTRSSRGHDARPVMGERVAFRASRILRCRSSGRSAITCMPIGDRSGDARDCATAEFRGGHIVPVRASCSRWTRVERRASGVGSKPVVVGVVLTRTRVRAELHAPHEHARRR